MTEAFSGDLIVSRLLIVQSKRLILSVAQHQLRKKQSEELVRRVEKLLAQIASAQHEYSAAVLKYGSPETAGYWLVAYSRLIEKAGVLQHGLHRAAGELPVDERYEVSAEIEMLDGIIESWTRSMRKTMVEAVA